jgi:hypothetical protein
MDWWSYANMPTAPPRQAAWGPRVRGRISSAVYRVALRSNTTPVPKSRWLRERTTRPLSVSDSVRSTPRPPPADTLVPAKLSSSHNV